MPHKIQPAVEATAAAAAGASVSAYTFSQALDDTAKVVAIGAGLLSISWYLYRYYREWKNRKGTVRRESTANEKHTSD